ncbi:MAG TPA: hypothetical protein VNR90_01130 [Vicinamibacterales bacterium]|nr:hypothetical protein [Vicinamibacterales bacterium]
MKRILSLVLAVMTLAVAAAAQEKPDFTGTWKLAGDAPDQFTPSQIVVAKDATVLTVTTTGQMGEFKTTYKLDGTPGPSPLDFQGQQIDRTTKATWDDKKLTLSATSDMNGQTIEIKSVVSAGPDGTMIVETTFPDFQGGGAPITTKASYKKAP